MPYVIMKGAAMLKTPAVYTFDDSEAMIFNTYEEAKETQTPGNERVVEVIL